MGNLHYGRIESARIQSGRDRIAHPRGGIDRCARAGIAATSRRYQVPEVRGTEEGGEVPTMTTWQRVDDEGGRADCGGRRQDDDDATTREGALRYISNLHEMARSVGEGVTDSSTVGFLVDDYERPRSRDRRRRSGHSAPSRTYRPRVEVGVSTACHTGMRDDHRTRGRRCRHICNIAPYYVTEGREGNRHTRFSPGVFVQGGDGGGGASEKGDPCSFEGGGGGDCYR